MPELTELWDTQLKDTEFIATIKRFLQNLCSQAEKAPSGVFKAMFMFNLGGFARGSEYPTCYFQVMWH